MKQNNLNHSQLNNCDYYNYTKHIELILKLQLKFIFDVCSQIVSYYIFTGNLLVMIIYFS